MSRRLHPRVEAAGRPRQCVSASRPPPAKLDTPLLKGTRFPITILRKHPIVPSKIEELQDKAQQEQEQPQKQEPSQQQNQEQNQQDPHQAASSTMAPNTPEDPGEPNFNGEEVEEYPETTALITPPAPTLLTLETPSWPAPSPPTPIARTATRRDSYDTQEGGGDLERGATGTSSGRKIIR